MPGPAFIKRYAVVNTVTVAQLASLVSGSGIIRGNIYVISDSNDVMVGLTSTTYQILPTSGGGGGTAWGAITGTLSSQADLAAALNGKQATLVSGTNLKTINSTSLLGSGDIVISGGSGNAVIASVDFGSTYTDKAQVVVTGQSWVTALSKINAQVRCPVGIDPDEICALNFNVAVSDLVVGVGFTVTLYTSALAKGIYPVNCIGV
jgi:hypothetical protein